jgi:hypothetical protein
MTTDGDILEPSLVSYQVPCETLPRFAQVFEVSDKLGMMRIGVEVSPGQAPIPVTFSTAPHRAHHVVQAGSATKVLHYHILARMC